LNLSRETSDFSSEEEEGEVVVGNEITIVQLVEDVSIKGDGLPTSQVAEIVEHKDSIVIVSSITERG
jgi:hypothetical protein